MSFPAERPAPPIIAALSLALASGLVPIGGIAQETAEPTDGPTGPAERRETGEARAELDAVVVTGVRERAFRAGTLKDVIEKTETVDAHSIESRQALNLSMAIAESPGVRVSNECSMCGVKRIMLNGMRGEHTTILTDGIPLHTMLAGFYAVDAIATTGVSRIEVARGAGASLTGAGSHRRHNQRRVQVPTLRPPARGGHARWTRTTATHVHRIFGALVSDDGRTRASLAVQLDDTHVQFDGDGNRVSEAPLAGKLPTTSRRISHDWTDRDNVTVRVGYTESEIFGGPTFVGGIDGVLRGFDGVESEQLFVDDDVRENLDRQGLGNHRVDRYRAHRGFSLVVARIQPQSFNTTVIGGLLRARAGLVLRGIRLSGRRRAVLR